jgi:hypothetical protein
MKYFGGSFIFTGLCRVRAALWGIHIGASVLATVFTVVVLGVAEVSLSFDNAVINATVLKDMSNYWRKIFITIGVLIAVFGMRFLFPILVVSITSSTNPLAVISMGLHDQPQYAMYLALGHPAIAMFGGIFLACIFINWILEEKEITWIPIIEKNLGKLGTMPIFDKVLKDWWLFLFIFATLVTNYLEVNHQLLYPYGFAILTYVGIKKLGDTLKDNQSLVKSVGLGMFLYLEVLDASF